MRSSIVIPSFNGRLLLATCLPALTAELPSSAEIIVVDNGSRDSTAEWLSHAWPGVSVVELKANAGFAAACNAGAKAARGPTVIFLNNDAIVQPGWLEPLVTSIEREQDVVVAGGLTLFAARPEIVNSAGTRLTLSAAGADIGYGLHVQDAPRIKRPVAGVSGVSMAVDRAWFVDVGGFDERFFMYFEDVDLCLRAWLTGFRVMFIPDSVVLHAFGATSGSRHSAVRSFYGSRNRVLIAAKSFGRLSAPVAIVMSVIQDAIVILHLLTTGRWNLAVTAASGKTRGTFAGLAIACDIVQDRLARPSSRRRSVRDLRREGIIDSIPRSVREFIRLRQVALR